MFCFLFVFFQFTRGVKQCMKQILLKAIIFIAYTFSKFVSKHPTTTTLISMTLTFAVVATTIINITTNQMKMAF